MDFNQLRYIVEIVETGSISKAASNLFISQPNLSNQITSLENEIGKNIFYRNNRGVTLTSYGVEVYHHAKSLVKQFEIIEGKLLTKSNGNKIKIASFGSEVINFQFYEVCRRYNNENYEFELYESGVEESIEKVITRDCDIGIIIYSEFQRKKLLQYLVAEGLELQDLFVGQMKIHMSKKYEKSKMESLSRDDLQGLFHVKKTYLFEGMFSLNYELEYLGIPETNKTILANGNKTYNDALHNLPSFAMEIDWKCKKKIHSDLARISYEKKHLDITCAMVKRKNEILKEELLFFVDKLIESYN
ncbi:LysR family transcriptional regulator [Tissierella sp. MB52-C2]|uniref:LysR family transcriptional regulator n=1 Tax=Tissierella sp. MB52-C2 TaxID=3070999 RepID=UPI00280B4DBD|nr:LysR family transcriptional regulator [Tissierella sp. MB52-C2]WMM25191.1 LysR family transcriptional regulator [Tissierella sp. MB52-C2]